MKTEIKTKTIQTVEFIKVLKLGLKLILLQVINYVKPIVYYLKRKSILVKYYHLYLWKI